MIRRITILVLALMMALMMAVGAAGVAFGDPNCTGNPASRPAACHDSGHPGPANFVGPGGGARTPNH